MQNVIGFSDFIKISSDCSESLNHFLYLYKKGSLLTLPYFKHGCFHQEPLHLSQVNFEGSLLDEVEPRVKNGLYLFTPVVKICSGSEANESFCDLMMTSLLSHFQKKMRISYMFLWFDDDVTIIPLPEKDENFLYVFVIWWWHHLYVVFLKLFYMKMSHFFLLKFLTKVGNPSLNLDM